MICPNCENEITKKDKFCKYCGQKINTCPFCYRGVEPDKEKCPYCNRILIERMSEIRERINYQEKTKDTSEEKPPYSPFSSKKTNYRKYIMVFIGVLLLIWLFSNDAPDSSPGKTLPGDDSPEITSPEEILKRTHGEFTVEEYNPVSFGKYYELRVPQEEEIIYDPLLEYMDFDPCRDKTTYVNFEESVYSRYSFNYKSKSFTYKVKLFSDLYYFSKNLKDQDCYFDHDYSDKIYFEDPYNNYFIEAVSEDFVGLEEKGYSKDEIVEIATLFVQSIPYGNTEAGVNNQYPYETFYTKEGNCLDKSVILAGILKNLGYTTYTVTEWGNIFDAPHALVGFVCEDGNTSYAGKEICFIETTWYEPIGFDVDLDNVEEYYKVSSGPLVYSEENYGKDWSEYNDGLWAKSERKESRIDSIEEELRELERKMCNTDCKTCYLDSSGEYITISYNEFCDNAHQYNRYIDRYGRKYQDYESLFEELYKIYYEREKAIFWNN